MSSDCEFALRDLSKKQHDRAIAGAQAYLRTAEELHKRARLTAELSRANLVATERALRIARQVLARIEMLGIQFERN
jgi:hypothetical protein